MREGLARQPKSAALQHSLGLLLVRQNKLSEALPALQSALDLAPGDTRFRYVYAVALHSAGKTREARRVVQAGLNGTPGDPGLRELAAALGR